MVRHLFLVSLILTLFLKAQAQQVELMFNAGLATYTMGEMKKLNSELQEKIPFTTEVTSNFPITPQLGGHFAVQLSHLYKLGILYAFSSTGSRIAASDYSGSYHFDNVLTGHTIGVLNSFYMYEYKALRVDFQTNLGVVMSNIRMTEELNVADTTVSTSEKFSSIGLFFEPKVEVTYQWKYLKTGLYLGYFVNPGGKIRDSSGGKTKTATSWSGLRFGIEIGICQMNR